MPFLAHPARRQDLHIFEAIWCHSNSFWRVLVTVLVTILFEYCGLSSSMCSNLAVCYIVCSLGFVLSVWFASNAQQVSLLCCPWVLRRAAGCSNNSRNTPWNLAPCLASPFWNIFRLVYSLGVLIRGSMSQIICTRWSKLFDLSPVLELYRRMCHSCLWHPVLDVLMTWPDSTLVFLHTKKRDSK